MKQVDFKLLLEYLGFDEDHEVYTKTIHNAELKVDSRNRKIIYPEDKGLKVNNQTISNFAQSENFVVFECVHRLLAKGYKPAHIELEPTWHLGHGASGGRADILVKDQQNNNLLLIECKTAGNEFSRAWNRTLQDGGQLFTYAHQIPTTQYLCLYASNFADGKIVRDSKIISHTDNEKFLQQGDNLRSFAGKIKDATDRFSIWRDTYRRAYSEVGIFESGIQAYQIGKNKYTLEEDTKPINARDKEGKYHQFRTILRKHSIARRETAFEILVNLFLCKIVDEEGNPQDLKFYWKGVAYDNYFDFVDRLLDLYQRGMDKFLNEQISYISNEQIDSAFWVVKSNKNATKEQIQKYFRELKFFTNSAFSFLDTHNEKLFYKNTEVLLEVVQMWQNLRLKSDEQNQFLGDMFEFFLDNSIKQSNGQYFTPLSICKFIVSALPLEAKVAASKEVPRVIDYACGSGHFLNEYAYQITPIAQKQNRNPASYYQHITGIEKEYRLAKVAKVAAYMYGQGQIQILDSDALANHKNIKRESYDVLVANPPFAVEGFLQTLSDEDKRQYALIEKTDESGNTKAIQCFFLERAHYLMAPDGVVGVIVPPGILSNVDSVHVRTRELLLQYFDFISIVKLGGGTFGKTGTSTVVLFLRRKSQRPECARHYKIRVGEFFQGNTKHEAYQDEHLVQAYCRHINIPYEEYAKLLTAENKKKIETLFRFEMFREYLQHWEKSTEVKNLIKTRKFQGKSKKDQQQDLDNRLLGYLYKCEKDKLFYFILAYQQAGKVLLANAPEGSKEQKEFLGYKWVKRKGSEGIKYHGGETVNDIVTPMFDPKNLDNPNKINTAIRKNFLGELTGSLPDYCQLANLVDMLDFNRTEFSKEISINPQKNININTNTAEQKKQGANATRDGMKKLSDVADVTAGQSPKGKYYNETGKGMPFYQGKTEFGETYVGEPVKWTTEVTKTAQAGDILMSVRAPVGPVNLIKQKICIGRGLASIRVKQGVINPTYLFHYLKANESQIVGSSGAIFNSISKMQIEQIKIIVPPLKVQEEIANECETVDKEAGKARQTIADNKQKIEQEVQKVINAGYEMKKLTTFADITSGGTPLRKEATYWKNGKIPWLRSEMCKERYLVNNSDYECITEEGLKKSNAKWVAENTTLIALVGATKGKTAFLKFKATTNQNIASIKANKIFVLDTFIYYCLMSMYTEIILNLSQYDMLNLTNIRDIKIPVPPLKAQQKLVAELEKLEEKITKGQAALDATPARKNAILKKYL